MRRTLLLASALALAVVSQMIWAAPPTPVSGAAGAKSAHAKVKKRSPAKARSVKRKSVTASAVATKAADPAASAHTCLIVDARGTRLVRGMGPRIFSQSGKLIYGEFQSNWEYAQEYGVAVYCNEMSEALNMPQAGSNPLVVGLAAVAPGTETDCILDDATAAAVLEAAARWDFLKYQRLILVVDN